MNHVTSLFFLPVSVWTNERSLIQWRNSQIFSVYFYGLSKNLYPWCSAGPLHLELRLFTDEPKLSGYLRPVPSMRHVCRKLMVVVVIKTYTQSKMMNTTTVHDSLQGRIIDGIGFWAATPCWAASCQSPEIVVRKIQYCKWPCTRRLRLQYGPQSNLSCPTKTTCASIMRQRPPFGRPDENVLYCP